MKGWILCTLISVVEETHDTRTFRFKLAHPMPFLAGQFVMLSFAEGAHAENPRSARAYSIASSPLHQQEIELVVRINPEGFLTPLLFDTKVGDAFRIKGPYGKFTFKEGDSSDLVFIGAGSGIAPLIGIIKYLVDADIPARMRLIYVDKTEKDLIARVFFEQLAREGKLDLTLSVTRETNESWKGERGRIDEAKIVKLLKNKNIKEKIANRLFYICGAPAMVNDTSEFLRKQGVAPAQIRTEKYD